MSKWYEGQALRTSGDPLAADAKNGSQISVFIPSGEAGPETVRISLASTGMSGISSAQVLYCDNTDDLQGARTVHVAKLPSVLVNDENGIKYVQFVLDPGTPGRSKAFEVARVTLH